MSTHGGVSYDGVIFDLYGTIFVETADGTPWEDYHNTYLAYVRGRGIDIAFGEFKNVLRAHKENGGEDGSVDQPPGCSLFELQLFGECQSLGLRLQTEELHRLSRDLCGTWQRALIEDPDFRPLVSVLRDERNLKTALLTNFDHPPHVSAMLDETGLAGCFETVVISGDTGTKKPDPAIFHRTMNELGIDPERSIYVGDSYVDYRGSLDAGMHPAVIRRNGWVTGSFHDDEEKLLMTAFERREFSLISSLRDVVDIIDRG